MQTKKRNHVLALCVLLAAVLSVSGIFAFAIDDKAAKTPQYAYVSNQSVYFYDVATDYQWAFHEVDYLATMGITQGTGDYLFEPEASISRGDFVLMLYRAYDMTKYAMGEAFPDVPSTAYYYDAVRAAKTLGITSGDEGRFLPEAPVTREDAMVFLLRTLEKTNLKLTAKPLSAFPDADKVSLYAADAVGKLVGAGVIGGDEKNCIAPASGVTRAEMSVMLYRALMIESGTDGAYYVAHPQRINLCIGSKIYSGAIIEDYDATKIYAGLMELTSFTQKDGGYQVRLGASQAIDKQVTYQGGKFTVDGRAVPVAKDAVAIQVAPYCVLDGLQTTGAVFPHAMPEMNDKGEVTTVYYARA